MEFHFTDVVFTLKSGKVVDEDMIGRVIWQSKDEGNPTYSVRNREVTLNNIPCELTKEETRELYGLEEDYAIENTEFSWEEVAEYEDAERHNWYESCDY